jgi:hypothetical protein
MTHITIEREKLERALEALEYLATQIKPDYEHNKAITAIKQARALDKKAENARELGLDYEPVREDWGPGPHEVHSLPPAAPVQEPVAQAWDEGYRAGIDDERTSEASIGIAGFDAKVEPARNNPYRTTPPAAKRPWTKLTDEEIQVVLDDPQKYYDTMNDFARAIEAKLKERNQ